MDDKLLKSLFPKFELLYETTEVSSLSNCTLLLFYEFAFLLKMFFRNLRPEVLLALGEKEVFNTLLPILNQSVTTLCIGLSPFLNRSVVKLVKTLFPLLNLFVDTLAIALLLRETLLATMETYPLLSLISFFYLFCYSNLML